MSRLVKFLTVALCSGSTYLAPFSASFAAPQEPFDLSAQQAGQPMVEKNEAAIAALPPQFRLAKEGTLSIASTLGAAPISTYATDGSTAIGFDPELGRLIGKSLGLQVKIIPVAWPDWPLGIISGKYDAVISNVAVTEERKERFDFSTYRRGLYGFYVANDSKIQSITQPKDIAGLRVITDSGTIQERIALEWNRLNEQAGLAPAQLLYYDDEVTRDLALTSGRADVIFSPDSSQAYQALKKGNKRRVGAVNSGWPKTADMGVVTKKGSGLAKPIALAIDGLIASGAYENALRRWNLTAEKIEQSEVNPPGLPKFK
jgi:polar amino acid transport system substrate-binding protein